MDDPQSTPGPIEQLPGVLSANVDLAAGETKIVNVPVGPFDFVLDGITVKSDGPVLLKIGVQAPAAGAESMTAAPEDYAAALATEYPAHLAALAGETQEEWQENNNTLAARASAGDDEAFLELIGRDPRVLGSLLTLANVVRWRTDLERYTRFYRMKPSALFRMPGADSAKISAEEARRKLRRLGEVHIAAHDQRGKKLLPPVGAVKGFYYAFLCLFAGIKREFAALAGEVDDRVAHNRILDLVEAIAALRPAPVSFAIWVVRVAQLIPQLHISDRLGLTIEGLPTVVGSRSAKPSETALALTAEAFEISPDTVERLKESDTVIPWEASDGMIFAIGGRPAFQLADFPEFRPLLKEPDPLK